MAQKSALSFSTISNYFKINQKQLKRGELSFLSGYVLKIIFDPFQILNIFTHQNHIQQLIVFQMIG